MNEEKKSWYCFFYVCFLGDGMIDESNLYNTEICMRTKTWWSRLSLIMLGIFLLIILYLYVTNYSTIVPYYITYIKSFLVRSRASSGSLFSFRTPQPPHRDMDDEKDLVDREENDDALDDTNTQVRIFLQIKFG